MNDAGNMSKGIVEAEVFYFLFFFPGVKGKGRGTVRSKMNGIVTAAMPVTVLRIPVEEKETERSSGLLKATQLVGGSQELDPKGWALNHHSFSEVRSD